MELADNRDHTTAPLALEVRDLHVDLGGIEILKGVNAKLRKGEITALIGPNGAGKTTFLLALLEMIPYRGKIIFGNGQTRPTIGYVPQQFEFDRGLPVTVADFLCLSRQRRPVWLSHHSGIKALAKLALSRVNADHLFARRLGNLSGGEIQRVLLALALLEEPSIILLDEPASAVDRTGEELFLRLIKELNQERGLTFLMVSHDLSMVTRLAGQVICLNREVLSEGKVSDVINEQTLSRCFGADKGLMLHDHAWGAELSCAYDEQNHEGHEDKPKEEKTE